jgi:hypothetical protein
VTAPPRGAVGSRVILTGIVLIYVFFASVWVTRTPPFAPPDEMAHADYMFALFDAGQFYRVSTSLSANDVLPETRYIDTASGYRRIHYNELGRVASGFGSAAFFRAFVARAPGVSGKVRLTGSAMPYVMFAYPATYYLLVAAVAKVLTGGNPHASVQAFYIARSLSVLLGVGTILLAFSTFVARRFGVATSLVAASGIAMLPMFCWVTAYVQPDDLVVFLVSLAVWSVCARPASIGWLAFAVSCLCLVKPHYGLALWVPALFFASSRGNYAAARLRSAILMALLPLGSIIVSFTLTPVCGGLITAANAFKSVGISTFSIASTLGELKSIVASVYVGGAVFTNYWFGYGIHGYYFTKAQSVNASATLCWLTLPLVIGCLAFSAQRLYRIARIAWKRGLLTAARLIASGYVTNVYFSYSAVLIWAAMSSSIRLALEARYWLPLVVPTTIILIGDFPRVVPRLHRVKVRLALALAVLFLSAPIDMATPWVIQRDYYTSTMDTPRFDFGGVVVNGSGDYASFHSSRTRVSRVSVVDIRGFVLDMTSGLPPDRIAILSDGHVISFARRIRWDVDAAAQWHDDDLESSAFEARIRAERFGIGQHDVTVVAWRHGERPLPLEHRVTLDVTQ